MHTHSPAATALSTLVEEIPSVHYYVAMFGGPVAVAPYATYGTEELARNVVDALRDRTGCLMGNHGAVTVGPDLVSAHDKSVYLEWLCDVYLRASSAGSPRLLPAAEIDAVAVKMGDTASGRRARDGVPGHGQGQLQARVARHELPGAGCRARVGSDAAGRDGQAPPTHRLDVGS